MGREMQDAEAETNQTFHALQLGIHFGEPHLASPWDHTAIFGG
jgi:hypothetical protein